MARRTLVNTSEYYKTVNRRQSFASNLKSIHRDDYHSGWFYIFRYRIHVCNFSFENSHSTAETKLSKTISGGKYLERRGVPGTGDILDIPDGSYDDIQYQFWQHTSEAASFMAKN